MVLLLAFSLCMCDHPVMTTDCTCSLYHLFSACFIVLAYCVCVSLPWSPVGLSVDAATLVAYGGSGAGRSPLTTLTTIGKAKDYNDTMRLGVVLTAGYSTGALQQPMRGPNAAVDPAVLHAYVYVDGVIETYEVRCAS